MTYPLPAVERDLTYRRIDRAADLSLAYANYRETCIASFGSSRRCMTQPAYAQWLARRTEE